MSPKRELLHEWMHRFQIADGTIRVWTKAEPGFDMRECYRQRGMMGVLIVEHTIQAKPLMAKLAELDFVNAVEVLDSSGNGRLVYVDWP